MVQGNSSFPSMRLIAWPISINYPTVLRSAGRFMGEIQLQPDLSFFPALLKCPLTHPYPLDGGRHCCKIKYKLNDTTAHYQCDGSRIRFDDSLTCCRDAYYIPCGDPEQRCNRPRSTARSWSWPSLSLTFTCVPSRQVLPSQDHSPFLRSSLLRLSFGRVCPHQWSVWHIWCELLPWPQFRQRQGIHHWSGLWNWHHPLHAEEHQQCQLQWQVKYIKQVIDPLTTLWGTKTMAKSWQVDMLELQQSGL